MIRRLALAAVIAGAVTVAPSALSGSGRASPVVGTLSLHAVFPMTGGNSACPAGYAENVECHPHKGQAIVPGLGTVSELYSYPALPGPPGCPDGQYRVLAYTVRFTVAGKGEIYLAVPGSAGCLPIFFWPSPMFTITGGSGIYVGASGSGTFTMVARQAETGIKGTDTWVGTLNVPGLAFDLTAPVLSGAVNQTIRAPRGKKRVRVRYTVTAQDAVDAGIPVTCAPKSGSWFKVGRTLVHCSATDKSGNTKTAAFTVTVKAAKKQV